LTEAAPYTRLLPRLADARRRWLTQKHVQYCEAILD